MSFPLHACDSSCGNISDETFPFVRRCEWTIWCRLVVQEVLFRFHLFIWRRFSYFKTGKQSWIVINTLNFTPHLYFSWIHCFSSKPQTEAGHSQF